VHGQFVLHGVDPLKSADPLLPALDHADHRLPAGMHINVLDRDFLLTGFFAEPRTSGPPK
jgi:hypothetical protein